MSKKKIFLKSFPFLLFFNFSKYLKSAPLKLAPPCWNRLHYRSDSLALSLSLSLSLSLYTHMLLK